MSHSKNYISLVLETFNYKDVLKTAIDTASSEKEQIDNSKQTATDSLATRKRNVLNQIAVALNKRKASPSVGESAELSKRVKDAYNRLFDILGDDNIRLNKPLKVNVDISIMTIYRNGEHISFITNTSQAVDFKNIPFGLHLALFENMKANNNITKKV